MVFNEILIPQDSFTETNVTRKRSVVENSYRFPKSFYLKFHTFFLYPFIFFGKYGTIILSDMLEITHKNKIKMLKNKYQNDSYQNTNRNNNILVLDLFPFLLFSVAFTKKQKKISGERLKIYRNKNKSKKHAMIMNAKKENVCSQTIHTIIDSGASNKFAIYRNWSLYMMSYF